GSPLRVRKRTKLRVFCLRTAILLELHQTVADGAIRESQSHGEYALGQPPSGDGGGNPACAHSPRGRVPRLEKSHHLRTGRAGSRSPNNQEIGSVRQRGHNLEGLSFAALWKQRSSSSPPWRSLGQSGC